MANLIQDIRFAEPPAREIVGIAQDHQVQRRQVEPAMPLLNVNTYRAVLNVSL